MRLGGSTEKVTTPLRVVSRPDMEFIPLPIFTMFSHNAYVITALG